MMNHDVRLLILKQSPPFGVPRWWLELLGEKLWVYKTFANYKLHLHKMDFDIRTHPSMKTISLDLCLIMVFVVILFCCNRFEDA